MANIDQLKVFKDDPFKYEKRKEKMSDSESTDDEVKVKAEKSVFKAYLWLIFGGFVGAHHIYLNNDYQAVLLIASVGGCYGLGLIMDFFYIPRYVEQANNHPYFKDLVELEKKHFKKPRLHVGMIIIQLVIGAYSRTLATKSIPYNEYTVFRNFILPLASTIGVWLVGKVFHAKSSFKATLLGSYLSFFVLQYILHIPITYFPFDTTLGAVVCYARYQSYNTSPSPGKILKHKKKIFLATLVVMVSLQGCYYYNNATISIQGIDLPLKDVLIEFFNSSAWIEARIALGQFYEEVWVIGVMPALNRLQLFNTDSLSEEAAYVIIGVEENITNAALKKRFRALTLEYHPDKQSPDKREMANKHFMELKAAYEVIIKMRSYKTKIEGAKLLKEISDRLNKYGKKEKKLRNTVDL
ncbi:dnaJ homolog subfamily C member 22-like [Bolinopsis microptera]|uniref:dnaJ homolog subfamily C member 22-like n=1 Tax=Bolinopsis microptera TaxID=2820187 RepID=UPI003079516B